MAETRSSDGTRIYYEVHGTGDPVLLVMGLGSNAYGWSRTLPWITERFQAIVFDNRGTGRSDVPDGAYDLRQMAADAAAVLDAAGHASAHVVGASLGGMIAQRFAITWPDRVRTLLLLCTTPGSPNAAHASNDVIAGLVATTGDPAEDYRARAWFLYSERTRTEHPELIEEDLELRMRIPTQPAGYLGQLQASLHHDAWDELGSLRMPALVVHGSDDMLIPVQNGRMLAERIPGARFVEIAGAGHMLNADAGSEVRDAVFAFLDGSPRSDGSSQR